MGWPVRRIAEATGVDRATARGYLRAAGIPVRGRGPARRTGGKTGHFRARCPPTLCWENQPWVSERGGPPGRARRPHRTGGRWTTSSSASPGSGCASAEIGNLRGLRHGRCRMRDERGGRAMGARTRPAVPRRAGALPEDLRIGIRRSSTGGSRSRETSRCVTIHYRGATGTMSPVPSGPQTSNGTFLPSTPTQPAKKRSGI